MPAGVRDLPLFYVPLRTYNISGIDNMRRLLQENDMSETVAFSQTIPLPPLETMVNDLYIHHKKVIFTMGKGGVGKTAAAIEIAKGLAERGCKVHLTTTDPAGHMAPDLEKRYGIEVSNIDEKEELKNYQNEVIEKAIGSGISEDDLDYIKEDLRSPCT
jgi:arsenite-transporting ATPase